MLEPDVVEWHLAPDRGQHDVALGRRAVIEIDHMRAIPTRTGPRRHRSNAGRDRDAVGLERLAHDVRVARMVGRRQARPRLDDRHRHAEPGVDLGKLTARRPAAEDEQAPWQLPGQRRLLVGPDADPLDAGDRDRPRSRPDRDDHIGAGQDVAGALVADTDAAATDDARLAAIHDGARLLERTDVAGVVGLRGVGSTVDHEIAVGRCPRPLVAHRVGVVFGRPVEQRLRREDTRCGDSSHRTSVDRRLRRRHRARAPCAPPPRRPDRRR